MDVAFQTAESKGEFLLPSLHFSWETLKIQDRLVRILSFEGQISEANSYELNHKFIHAVQNGSYTDVILDLSELRYTNSQGIAILHSLVSRLKERDIRPVIGGMHPFSRTVFSLIEDLAALKVFDSPDEAKKFLPWQYHSST